MTSTRPEAPAQHPAGSTSQPRPPKSLTPVEMAQAAVMGALSAALAIISVVVPFAGGVSLLVAVPMGILGYRYRLRVLLAAAFAAATVTFLIAGISGFMVVLNCAYVGGATGIIKRRRRGAATLIAVSIIAGALNGAWIIGVLLILVRLRTLVLEALSANVNGVLNFMSDLPVYGEVFRQSAEQTRAIFETAIRYWPVLIMAYSIFTMVVVSLVGWWALGRVLERLRGVPDVHKLDPSPDGGPVGPVPVRLADARFRYPGADHDALRPVTLTVEAGEHIAVTGANGSGKTTLMLLLCGREPTSGVIERPGAVGLGRLGGTAVVMQHPESQVLGTRVADDVVWGLPPGTSTDVPRLLDEVGLTGMEERDTGGLSGGELQRLAVAAALAREPAMMIADEITTMVDQKGRDGLLSVLSGLTERHRMALVHITHYTSEAEIADRTVNLSESQDNMVMVGNAEAPSVAQPPSSGKPVLELRGVGHVYADRTPWAKTALSDITFTVNEGDGVLIHGGNGSGKSTLAWIMAGLTTPTTGECLVRGRRADECVGDVAIAFQAARLQLLRSRVDLEVASAAGFSPYDTPRVVSALATVGLDGSLAQRRVDQLSGGQMRRVVIAGLLARWPQALILDEPLAGLDAASQRGLLRLLTDLRLNTGLTVIVISHDFAGLEELCPRTIHLDRGVLVGGTS